MIVHPPATSLLFVSMRCFMSFTSIWTSFPPHPTQMLAAWLFSELCLMPALQNCLPVAVGGSGLSSGLLLQIAASSWWHYSSSLSGVFTFLQTFIINSLSISEGCSKEGIAHCMSQIWALLLLCLGDVLPLPVSHRSACCTKAGWGACGCFWIPDWPKYCFLFTSLPKKLHGRFMEELRKWFVSTSTCWNKQFPQTVAANELLVLSPFFGSVSTFKLPRFVCLFLGTMFGVRALLFNWTTSFPCQWSTLHIPHLLRSLKEFKQTLWGPRQLLLCRADTEGMLSSFKRRSPHVTKSLKWFCFRKVECN